MLNYLKTSTFFIVVLFLLTSCGGFKVPNKSARDQPVNAEDRIQKNIKGYKKTILK